jgi:hypothetical protein
VTAGSLLPGRTLLRSTPVEVRRAFANARRQPERKLLLLRTATPWRARRFVTRIDRAAIETVDIVLADEAPSHVSIQVRGRDAVVVTERSTADLGGFVDALEAWRG